MKKTLQKPYNNGYIRVVVSIENNRFSVTGSIYEPFEKDYHRDIDSWHYLGNEYGYAYGGCIHNDVLKAYPILKPIVDLHLCDHYGTPMHCIENAYYHYECGNKAAFRDHLMIDNYWADLLIERLDRETKGKQYRKLLLANRIYEGLTPIWEEKAARAMEVYNNLIDHYVSIENDLYEHSAE